MRFIRQRSNYRKSQVGDGVWLEKGHTTTSVAVDPCSIALHDVPMPNPSVHVARSIIMPVTSERTPVWTRDRDDPEPVSAVYLSSLWLHIFCSFSSAPRDDAVLGRARG